MSEITNALYKLDELNTENNYSQFFNPNICHVCKRPSQGELMPCGSCDMVFYCSKEHQIMHQSSHMEICIVITFARSGGLESNASSFNSDDEWRSSRKTFMQGIQMKMTRDLKPYEKEMIICAKSCLICHQQISLRTCRTCYSANYCDEHQWDFKEKHESMCKKLLLFLNFNILNVCNDDINTCLIEMRLTKIKIDFDDMITFVNQYIRKHYLIMGAWSKQCYMLSNLISAPLTLLYGLKEFVNIFEQAQIYREEYKLINGHRSFFFIVHIIGASSADITGLPSWEIFLHIFNKHKFSINKIMELRVILVAPETDCDRNEYYSVCSECVQIKRHLYLGNASVSYEEYIRTNLYKQANIIIAFQAEFSMESPMLDIFIKTQDRTCPFFFTTASQNEAEESIKKIQEVMYVPREHRFIENKFRSYKPYRNYETVWERFRDYVYLLYFPFLF
ncbi:uncharacterized protein LOC116842923 isoform X2 [Odontomachus brunneus]|uniref:uncharacterized protein LOC116842923 isoform X2 n=1 Tax=Odontomachus brunneus TaxID=486640 RepID=UPI0013F26E82|nr:uncharacterized protein LOC116842923 isoform X2 [Odontomachus brunneus]